MLRLFFDTETTGLPKSRSARNHDVDNWPRLVQLAWMICEDEGEVLLSRDHIIAPVGFTIPEDASAVHGITTEMALDAGIHVSVALAEMTVAVELVNLLVGHGIYFDKSVVGAEYIRLGMEHEYEGFKSLKRFCTMQKSVKVCKIPFEGRGGYKWPKLTELHQHLFNEDFEGAHDALADVMATVKCYFNLIKQGVE